MGKFLIKKAGKGFAFALKANNGEVIGVSETYASESGLKNGIDSVKRNAPNAPIEDQTAEGFKKESNPKFEIYYDKKEEFRFRLKAGNGEIILASEGYKSKAGCKNGINSVKENAADSEIVEE